MITYRVYENQCILMSYFSGDVVTFFCFVCYFAFPSRITNNQFRFIFHSHNIMMFGRDIFLRVLLIYNIHSFTTFCQRSMFDRCLLYTSDAADDMQCVDLGGRRIIKKKFFQAEDGIRDFCLSRGLGDVYKRQIFSSYSHLPSRIHTEDLCRRS